MRWAANLGWNYGLIRAVAFSPDSASVAAHDGNEIRLWELRDIRGCLQDRAKPRPPPWPSRTWPTGMVLQNSIAFSPDGWRIFAPTTHGSTLFWQVPSGLWIPTPGYWNRAGELMCGAAYSPNGERGVAGAGATLLHWDSFTGVVLHVLTGHTAWINAVAASSDGRWVASAGRDGMIKVWDLGAGREVRTFLGHDGPVLAAAFSPDGRRLFTGGEDGTLRIWDFAWPAEHRALEARLAGARESLGRSPDDPQACLIVGRWYALNGAWDWAVELLERARAGGADVPALSLARCYWKLGDSASAAREFRRAAQRGEAREAYLELCAVSAEQGGN